MPGIVGLITSRPANWAQRKLRLMMTVIQHEDFYVTGTWADEEIGVYIGWTARKGSFADGMPLRNERGDVVLVFSGEEFPEPGMAARIRAGGHGCDSPGPCYLVHWAEEDSSFPASLNGRFHGLLVDKNRGTATLFNDRYGLHRICYHESAQGFYFAAEAKAILAVCPEQRQLHAQSAGEFISCGAVLENRTLFRGVYVLPGASAWRFRKGVLERKVSYFHPREWEDQETLEPDAYYKQLRETFAENLPRYFEGHERIGMSLTGGLDTRMVLAWHKAAPGSLPCYTFGSMLRENEDVRVARRVAMECQQPFHVIPAGQEFLSQFPRYAERAVYLTDGCVDVSRAPDLYLNERARQIAPVRMTGNYGGEILRTYRAFKPEEPLPGLFHSDFRKHISGPRETYRSLVQAHPVSFAAFQQTPWHHYGISALEQTQLAMRSPFLDNDLVRLVFRAPQSALAGNETCQKLIADGCRALSHIPTDRGLGGERSWIVQQASHALLEFSFKAEYAYDMGMPQWLARIDHAVCFLGGERLFLGRHKVFHFRVWYRDYLAGYVREILLDPRTLSRPYLERKFTPVPLL